MAVGVVALYAIAQPDNVLDTQIVGEDFLVIFALHSRVALLHFTEKAFFGSEQSPLAVDLNRAAFEDDALAIEKWTEFLAFGLLRHQAANFVVMLEVGIFRPSVE